MNETSILELQSKMESGELSAREITMYYLERIERVDRSGPAINAVIEVNPDVLDIAQKLDDERAAGKARGPLHGIPILIKDNIDTADKMETTAGSLALEGNHPDKDAFIVKQLRTAGAVLLGKANLSEWANFRGKRSTSGWSSRGGLTRNPYALDRTACGSSSGSAAAVAADLCAASIGTETDGSITCPAQTCGVVGLKPTVGLLSRAGIIPVSITQDTAGPIGRTVEDVAVLLGAFVGTDPEDDTTLLKRRPAIKDYTEFLKPNGLEGVRIGVARNMLGSYDGLLAIFEESLDVMAREGAVLVDPADLPNHDEFGKDEIEVLHYEFKYSLNKYLAGLGPEVRVHSLKEVIQFNEDNRDRVMPYFGQERMIEAQRKHSLSTKKYREAKKRVRRLTRAEGIDALLKEHKLDAIAVITGGPAFMIDLVNGDAINWDMESTSPPAAAGYPHITVPAGYLYGLPVGISFFSKAWSEAKLLQIAYAFEQARGARVPPKFLETADLGL
jgi:amidase